MHDWEGLSLVLCYCSRGWYFVLELAAVEAVIPPKGQEDEFCQPVAATQGNLLSSAQCLQGFRWLTLASAESPPKSHLCCSRSGFDYSVKPCPFDILVREAWREPSRFCSFPRGRIQDYSHLHILGGISDTNTCSYAFQHTRFIGISRLFSLSAQFNHNNHFIYGRTCTEITPKALHHQITPFPENHRTSSSSAMCLQNKNNLFLTRKASLSSISWRK